MKKFLLPFAAGLLFIGCQSRLAPDSDMVSVKIVQMNDVYEIDALNGGKNGGLARVAFIRDSIKKENPNTYLFLAGDFLSPSLIGTLKVDGERLQGKQMVDVLNALNTDLVTFGNHEFDLKEGELQKRLNESTFKWTSANVRHVTNGLQNPFEVRNQTGSMPVSEYEIFTARNKYGKEATIGVFGVTLPSNPKDYVFYGDIYKEAVRSYELARNNSDFVVGLTHVALAEDREIARQIPDLRLIMGGHEHNHMLETEGNTKIAKADANAVSLYVHTLNYNMRTKDLSLASQLMMVGPQNGSDPKIEMLVKKWNTILDENLRTVIDNPNEVIYRTGIPWDGTDTSSRSVQTNLGEIIAKSMIYAYDNKPEAALLNGGGIRIDDKLTGDISGKDIFRVLPFGGQIFSVTLTGGLLTDVLNYGQKAAGTGAYLQRAYIAQGDSGEWLINGTPISKDKDYTVAMNDFLLMGLDIPFLTEKNPGIKKIEKPAENALAFDVRKAVVKYVKDQMK